MDSELILSLLGGPIVVVIWAGALRYAFLLVATRLEEKGSQ